MNNQESEQNYILNLIIDTESLLTELYRLYSKKVMLYNAFWRTLVTDTTEHVNWVRNLLQNFGNVSLYSEKDRFNVQAIESLKNFIQEKYDEFNNNYAAPDQLTALTNAMDANRSILERKVYRIYETDNDALKTVLKTLETSAQINFEKLQKEIKKEKASSLLD